MFTLQKQLWHTSPETWLLYTEKSDVQCNSKCGISVENCKTSYVGVK